jgi:ATP/maltotriose-dependent transcriptional regulator MalT
VSTEQQDPRAVGRPVKTHLLRIFNKLDVADRTAAVTTAMRLAIL